VFFQWSDHANWRFHEFLYLAMWATVHYLMAEPPRKYRRLFRVSQAAIA